MTDTDTKPGDAERLINAERLAADIRTYIRTHAASLLRNPSGWSTHQVQSLLALIDARDATIAARDATIADLRARLDEADTDANAAAVVIELAADMVEQDGRTIADLREQVARLSVLRDERYDAACKNIEDAGIARHMIRDALCELGPVGCVKRRDVGPPDYIADANEIIGGIQRLKDELHARATKAEAEVEKWRALLPIYKEARLQFGVPLRLSEAIEALASPQPDADTSVRARFTLGDTKIRHGGTMRAHSGPCGASCGALDAAKPVAPGWVCDCGIDRIAHCKATDCRASRVEFAHPSAVAPQPSAFIYNPTDQEKQWARLEAEKLHRIGDEEAIATMLLATRCTAWQAATVAERKRCVEMGRSEQRERFHEAEALLPYTWRSQPDFDAVVEDIARALDAGDCQR